MKNILIYFILSALILFGIFAGCSREIESSDLEFDMVDGPPAPINLQLTILPESITVNWQLKDTVIGTQFNVYYSDSLEGDYDSWDVTSDFSSTITGLVSGRQYYFKVASINSTGLEGVASDISTTTIGVLTASINGGSQFTNNRNVGVTFIVPTGASLVQLSEYIDFADAVWEVYTPSKTIQLSLGDGVKFVYARFQFDNGSISDYTDPVSDSIILDTETSIDSVYFTPSDLILSEGDELTFYVVTGEGDGEAAISFPGLNNYVLNYDADASDSESGYHLYRRVYTIPADLEAVGVQVEGSFTDLAGNSAPTVSSKELMDISNPPVAVSLTAVAESSSEIRLNWSESFADDFAAYQLYRGLNNTVSNDSDPIAVINNQNSLTYTDTGLEDDLRYYYRLYVYDNTGKYAPSDDADALTLTNDPPDAVTLAGRLDNDGDNDLAILTWTQNTDNDFESYRVYYTRNPADTVNYLNADLYEIINDQMTATYTDILPAAVSGNFLYSVVVFDAQGKTAPSNWVVVSK